MTNSKNNKINLYDQYVMHGGDMTLDEIETFVKQSLGISNIPLKKDMFDDFMIMIIEELNNRKK